MSSKELSTYTTKSSPAPGDSVVGIDSEVNGSPIKLFPVSSLQKIDIDNIQLFDDFIGYQTDTGGTLGWSYTASGAGAGVSSQGAVTDFEPAFGIRYIATGSTNAGYAGLHLHDTAIRFNAGYSLEYKTRVMPQSLSTVSEEFKAYIGLFDNATGSGDATDGVYFMYDRLTSVNWIMCTANNGTRTQTATSIPVTDEWQVLEIIVNSDGTSASFYIDGVLAGTITTNIPTSSVRLTGYSYKIEKSAGTSTRILHIDYFYSKVSFDESRE